MRNLWEMLFKAQLELFGVLTPYVIAQHEPTLVFCIANHMGNGIVNPTKANQKISERKMLKDISSAPFSCNEVDNTLWQIESMSRTLDCNNSASDSILEFNHILETNGTKMCASTSLIFWLDLKVESRKRLFEYSHCQRDQPDQDKPQSAEIQQSMHVLC